jgi:molecular chaperone GrpE
VVDEQPEALWVEDSGAGDASPVTEADLTTLAARVMVDNERLERLATQLERSAKTDEETQRLVRSMLPVLDSFDRVCEMARGFETSEVLTNWLRSVERVEARLLQTLESQGLEVLDPLGEEVDLNRDEVVEYRSSKGHPGDTVIEVRRKGYRFRGKLLRDTQVVIARNERRV